MGFYAALYAGKPSKAGDNDSHVIVYAVKSSREGMYRSDMCVRMRAGDLNVSRV